MAGVWYHNRTKSFAGGFPIRLVLLSIFRSAVLMLAFLGVTGFRHARADQILDQDAVWKDRMTVDGMLLVPPHITLSIRSGTRVVFVGYSSQERRSGLVVMGRIDVDGTREAPVEFVSSSGHPWQGISIIGSQKNNRLSSVLVSGAKRALQIQRSTASLADVTVTGGDVAVELVDSTVSFVGGTLSGAGFGISQDGGDLMLQQTTFSKNGVGLSVRGGGVTARNISVDSSLRRGISLVNSHYSLEDSRLVSNRIALTIQGGEGVIRRNRFESSSGDAVHVADSRVSITENRFAGNDGNAVTVRDRFAIVSRNVFEQGGGYDLLNLGKDHLHLPGNWWERKGNAARPVVGGISGIDVRPVLTERPFDP